MDLPPAYEDPVIVDEEIPDFSSIPIQIQHVLRKLSLEFKTYSGTKLLLSTALLVCKSWRSFLLIELFKVHKITSLTRLRALAMGLCQREVGDLVPLGLHVTVLNVYIDSSFELKSFERDSLLSTIFASCPFMKELNLSQVDKILTKEAVTTISDVYLQCPIFLQRLKTLRIIDTALSSEVLGSFLDILVYKLGAKISTLELNNVGDALSLEFLDFGKHSKWWGLENTCEDVSLQNNPHTCTDYFLEQLFFCKKTSFTKYLPFTLSKLKRLCLSQNVYISDEFFKKLFVEPKFSPEVLEIAHVSPGSNLNSRVVFPDLKKLYLQFAHPKLWVSKLLNQTPKILLLSISYDAHHKELLVSVEDLLKLNLKKLHVHLPKHSTGIPPQIVRELMGLPQVLIRPRIKTEFYPVAKKIVIFGNEILPSFENETIDKKVVIQLNKESKGRSNLLYFE